MRHHVCLVDPEGNHEAMEGTVVLGTAERAPTSEEVLPSVQRSEVILRSLTQEFLQMGSRWRVRGAIERRHTAAA
jgi:hypothetical protein